MGLRRDALAYNGVRSEEAWLARVVIHLPRGRVTIRFQFQFAGNIDEGEVPHEIASHSGSS